jgi:hypothetical protein
LLQSEAWPEDEVEAGAVLNEIASEFAGGREAYLECLNETPGKVARILREVTPG